MGDNELIPFFEWKYELYLVLSFIINPILCCLLVYWTRPRLLWLSPAFILCIFVMISAIFYPYYFQDIFNNQYDGTTIYWLLLVVPLQVIFAFIVPGITYLIIRGKMR